MRRFLMAVGMTLTITILLNSCSIRYQLDGASVDYNLIKTISIQDFPNYATLVNPVLSAQFSDALRNKYIRQTRLKIVESSADLELEGEITGYNIKGMAVKEDAFASMTELSVTVKIRYVNNKRPSDDIKDQSFTASKPFSNTETLDQVEDQLVTEIIDDLVDQIYNATLGNW